MERWLLWTIIGIVVLITASLAVVFLTGSHTTDDTNECDGVKYDPNTQQCISGEICNTANVCGTGSKATCYDHTSQTCLSDGTVCNNNSVCGTGDSATCIDLTKYDCVSDQPCEIANYCEDSTGNPLCIDPDSQVCMSDGTVCNNTAACGDNCIDLTQYTCVQNKSCANENVCKNSVGNTICIDPTSQTCMSDGTVCDNTAICGDGTSGLCYDSTSQTCMSDGTLCDNNAVCGSECIDLTKYVCVNGKACTINSSCKDSAGNPVCIDPTTQTCMPDGTVCDNNAVCGTGDSQFCIDTSKYTCINGGTCLNANVCKDSSGNPVCINPKTQTCMPDGTVCETNAVCGTGDDAVCMDVSKYFCYDDQECSLLNYCLDSKGNPVCMDPSTQTCINDGTVCDISAVCGTGNNRFCYDTTKYDCINNKTCDISAVCVGSSGNKVCYDPSSQTCLSNGIVCNNNSVCGTGDSAVCIDTSKYTCISGQPCLNDYLCGDSPNQVCCDNDQQCSSDGKCVTCATDLCGGSTCCASGQDCINSVCCEGCGDPKACCADGQSCLTLADKSTVCCDTGKICGDVCCDGACCNGVCCKSGESCVNGICCPSANTCGGECCGTECCGDVCCGNGTVCHNDVCMTACGDDFCDPTTQVCNTVSATGGQYCATQGCVWQGLVYDPGDLHNSSGEENIAVCSYDGKYYTCNNPSGVSTDKLTRSVTDQQDASSTAQCTVGDCDNRFSENGLIDVNFNSATRECTGSFDCSKKLTACGDCPLTGDDTDRCCTSNGKYTGQICPQNTICHSGECILGYYCGTNDGGFPQCQSTTDSSKVQYNSLSKCRAAGCMFQPASCYLDEVKGILNSKWINTKGTTDYGNYIAIAVYGVEKANCLNHSQYVNTKDTGMNDSNPWIGIYKATRTDVSLDYYFCAQDGYDSKKYYYFRGRTDSKMANAPELYSAIEISSECSTCTDTAPSGTKVTSNFDYYGVKPVPKQDGANNSFPAILIIVPSGTDASSSCAGSSSLSGNYGLLPVTRWNPAGVF